ncbi:MAG: protoglobin domain-containing protein [Gaiellaceae bacterium]
MTDPAGESRVEALSAAIGVTEAEISRRKELLEFRGEDVERLSSIGELAKECADPVIESFYAHLLSFEETAAFFTDPKVLAHAKQMQKEYFLGLTAGDYGEAYVENRLRVGAVHERIGVPAKAYLGMYGFYLRTVAARLAEAFAKEPGRANEIFDSLVKLVFLDIGLAIDTYIFQRDSRELRDLAAIIEASDDSIIATSLDGTILRSNPGAERLYGYGAREMVGQSFSAVTPPERLDELAGIYESVRRGESIRQFETVRRRKDGSLVDVSLTVSPIRNDEGEVIAVAMTARDIGERKRAEKEREQLEEQLRQSQKMEAIGKLAGGIAHDFNNLLLVIRGYSTILLKRNTDEGLAGGLVQIDNAANRATELTRQLLAFSRLQVIRPESSDLNDLVEETLKLLGDSLGEDIELVVELGQAPAPVVLDRGQFGQVILNLAVNARDAMQDGGMLTIRTANVVLDESYASEHVDVVPGAYALLQVTDSGAGMDDETQNRVFDPFFTTKPKGTGLGLATVYGIVKQNRGHIWFYSEPGLGTTFKIYFPHETTASVAAPAPEEPTSLQGAETILLVEDNDAVRSLVADLLTSYGYTVLQAADGPEAIEIAEQRHGSIDLLLTDVVMPSMNGRELAERLLAENPPLKVLFTSGYPEDTIVRHAIAEAHVAFIEKPYLPDDLARAVRTIFNSPKQ